MKPNPNFNDYRLIKMENIEKVAKSFSIAYTVKFPP